MTSAPLLLSTDLDAALAWHRGAALSRRRYLADVAALAERLPSHGAMLSLSTNRYRFAVAFGAALQRGHTSLLPPNYTPDLIARLQQRFSDVYAVVDDDMAARRAALALPHWVDMTAATESTTTPAIAGHEAQASGGVAVPQIDAEHIAAHVFTSGSTGEPLPHGKPWRCLVANARAESQRVAEALGRRDLNGVTLIGTVPAQHMYGFESTVLLALLSGAAFDSERPFYPADIAAALARASRPRVLVTTPFHLQALLAAQLSLPPADLILCATAPLSPQLASRAEAALAAPLLEIYGCTEAGQVATRRPVRGVEWQTYDSVHIHGDGDSTTVSGGHVPEPTRLADVVEVIDAEHFRLLGRSNDLVNIAGKRSSLSHLNYHLNAIDGVVDGAFWLPPPVSGNEGRVERLLAAVVAPGVASEVLLAALRQRLDAAFLPRRIVHVEQLPRDPSGKLPTERLALLFNTRPDREAGVTTNDFSPSEAAAESAPTTSFIDRTIALTIANDHPAYAGHFPGDPLLPGVTLLAEVAEAARADATLGAPIGSAPRLGLVKFLHPVRPGAALTARFTLTATALRFEVWLSTTADGHDQRLAASGYFERVDAPSRPASPSALNHA